MTKQIAKFLIPIFFGATALQGIAETVRYDLTATREKINLSGKKEVDWALMINGSIPAPTLEFTEGDDAEITVHNKLASEEVSLHWHGILLPPEMDGVSYVNTPPIHPGKSHTFRFKIRQHGTYWYHSHTMLQEQKGVFGAIVIHPRKKTLDSTKDLVVVLSDWSDENPDQIIKNLRKDGDYYLYKKNAIRSWFGAIQNNNLGTFLANEWMRMGGMDPSDVGYDTFLINGRRDSQLSDAKPGEKIRIRIINAAASSYFYISLGQEQMQVVASDGIDIEPVQTTEILIGMAETYDILYEVPSQQNVELRATAQDNTGYASGWIGSGPKVAVNDKPALDLYASMDHSAHQDHAMHHHHNMGPLTVDGIKSSESTAFPAQSKTLDIKLELGGDMSRYIWHINGKAIHQDRTIKIQEGDVVRFTFENMTMMHHPMHLHGHFFRVLNDQGDFSPLKHTVDVPPHGTRTIEFLANEPGEWMLHCHNLYHMKTGMARVVKYDSYVPSPEIQNIQKHDPHLHEHVYFSGMLEISSNHALTELRALRTWDALELHAESRDYKSADHTEGDFFYRRWFSNFFTLLGGATYVAEYTEHKTRGVFGFSYVLPMLLNTQMIIDHTGQGRLDLEKHFQWTSTIFTEAQATFRQGLETEFEITLMYGPSWEWSLGLMLTEDKLGGGLQYRF